MSIKPARSRWPSKSENLGFLCAGEVQTFQRTPLLTTEVYYWEETLLPLMLQQPWLLYLHTVGFRLDAYALMTTSGVICCFYQLLLFF